MSDDSLLPSKELAMLSSTDEASMVRRCTAIAASGERCKNRALSGQATCRVHSRGGGFKHVLTGNYSGTMSKRIKEKMRIYYEDESPLDLRGELALLRALLESHLETIDAEELDMPKIREITALVGDIGGLVERISRMMNATALTAAEVAVLQTKYAVLLLEVAGDDDNRRQMVMERLSKIGGV